MTRCVKNEKPKDLLVDGKRRHPNFGDEITPVILGKLFGVENQHGSIEDSDFLGTGSVLDKLFKSKSLYKRDKILHVVGSGLIEPKSSQQYGLSDGADRENSQIV